MEPQAGNDDGSMSNEGTSKEATSTVGRPRSDQPGGASVALRKLVEDARRVHADRDTVRASREATYRFMSAIAGHLPGFEEASRALFAGQHERFDTLVADWPVDVRTHLDKLSAAAWGEAA